MDSYDLPLLAGLILLYDDTILVQYDDMVHNIPTLLMPTWVLTSWHFIGCGWKNSQWTCSMWWMRLTTKGSLLFDYPMDILYKLYFHFLVSLLCYCSWCYGKMWTSLLHNIGWWVRTNRNSHWSISYSLIVLPHILCNLIPSYISLLFLCLPHLHCCQLSKVFNPINIVIRCGQYISGLNGIPFENEVVKHWKCRE